MDAPALLLAGNASPARIDAWLSAREALLRQLYPSDEAAVAELMAEAVRARVLDMETALPQ